VWLYEGFKLHTAVVVNDSNLHDAIDAVGGGGLGLEVRPEPFTVAFRDQDSVTSRDSGHPLRLD